MVCTGNYMNFSFGIEMTGTSKTDHVIEKLIYGFVILFLITLHNSIFLNQIGYYGALLLMLFKGVHSRKNPFHNTGLEMFFLLFILAEILSTIFSLNTGNAIQNLLKRFLLIPIVYVVYSAADTKQKSVTFFKIYIIAAVITLTVYIVFAYQHFLHQLYQLETKGPSPFQYVMTAGGLISFSVIFLFAFLVNERTGWRNRFFTFIAFSISLLALAASYTRAAWIGAAAGLFVILVLKRKWWIITPVVILVLVFLFTQKTTSKLIIQNQDNKYKTYEMNYHGKLGTIISDEGQKYLAGYDKGVLMYKDSTLVPVLKTKAPVDIFLKWKDNFYFTHLVDQRMEIYRNDSGRFRRLNEMISPGITSALSLSNGILYVTDQDSGLTVFPDPLKPEKKCRFPEYPGIKRITASKEYLVLYSNDNLLQVIKLENGLPILKIYQKRYESKYGFISMIDSFVLFNSEKNTELLKINKDSVIYIGSNAELNKIHSVIQFDGRVFASGFGKTVYELKYPFDQKLEIINRNELTYPITGFAYDQGTFFYVHLSLSRLNSIFDPYHETNIQRIYQWGAGIEIFKDHPFFGVGDIDMKKVYSKYMHYFEKETFGHLHNNYIQILAALGLFGFLAVILLFIKILLTHFKIYNSLKDIGFGSSYALGAFGAYIGFLVSGLAEWNFGDHEIITMVWFFLGLNLAFFRNYIQNQKPKITQENVVG